MEFEEWSNKKAEQQKFAAWGASRPPSVTDEERRASGEQADRRQWRKQGGERVAAAWDFGLSAAKEQNILVATEKERTQTAQPKQPAQQTPAQTATPAQTEKKTAPAASLAEKSQAQTNTPYIPSGQANRLGVEATPTKGFTSSNSSKAEIPTNRFSGESAALHGWEARTGMSAAPSSVNASSENPLATTPLGAYTNNWNLKTAGIPAASVFADIDDETLSRLIIDYSNQRRKLKSAKPGVTSYGERTQSLPALKDALGGAYDTLYPVALSMVCPRPKFEIPEDSSALLPDDNSESAGHTVRFPSTVSFPNFDELWGFPGRAGNSGVNLSGDSSGGYADSNGTSTSETDDGKSKEISIDLGIKTKSQSGLRKNLIIGDELTGQPATKIGCTSVAIAMALGVDPETFITTLNANGGYNSDNLLNWNKVEELYGYDLENESGGFEDTKESIVNYLETGIPVIGQIRRSGGGYHYFLITGFDGTVGKNTDGSYDLSSVTMDMFTVNDPKDGTSKTLTQAVGASNFNAIAVYIPPQTSKGVGGR